MKIQSEAQAHRDTEEGLLYMGTARRRSMPRQAGIRTEYPRRFIRSQVRQSLKRDFSFFHANLRLLLISPLATSSATFGFANHDCCDCGHHAGHL